MRFSVEVRRTSDKSSSILYSKIGPQIINICNWTIKVLGVPRLMLDNVFLSKLHVLYNKATSFEASLSFFVNKN
jgi:hypothetical protein